MRLAEDYLVVADAAAPTGTLDDDERRATRQRVDWDHVERLARWHRLEPLLWRSVSGEAALAPATRDRLQAAYLDNAARQLYLGAELARVLAALDAAGVAAMLLKGAALVEAVYSDPALRVMRDIDILVPAGDIERAQAAVAALGYAPGAVLHGEEGSQEWMAEHHHHLPPLIDPDRMLAVELHQHLVPPDDPARLDISGVWARARPGTQGPPHLLPAPEDLLAHVALHFARNRLWRSDGALGQVADVAWVLHGQALDWDALAERSGRDGVAASLFLALFAAEELLGAVVPATAMAALRPPAFRAAQGRRFIRRRVLRERPWLAVELLTAGRPPLMRAVPGGGWLREHYGLGDDVGLGRLYVRRAGAAARRFGPSLARPWGLGTDLVLNRWIRSLDRR